MTENVRYNLASAKKYRVGVIGSTGRGGYGHGLDTVWRDIPQAELVGVAERSDVQIGALFPGQSQ